MFSAEEMAEAAVVSRQAGDRHSYFRYEKELEDAVGPKEAQALIAEAEEDHIPALPF